MTVKNAIAWICMALVGALVVVTVALAIYRVFHPLQESQRAFVSDLDCSLSIENATICVKRQPPPRR